MDDYPEKLYYNLTHSLRTLIQNHSILINFPPGNDMKQIYLHHQACKTVLDHIRLLIVIIQEMQQLRYQHSERTRDFSLLDDLKRKAEKAINSANNSLKS